MFLPKTKKIKLTETKVKEVFSPFLVWESLPTTKCIARVVGESNTNNGGKLNIGKVGEYPPGAIDALKGGADQILLPFKYDINWIDKIYDTQTKRSYTLKEFSNKFPELIKK